MKIEIEIPLDEAEWEYVGYRRVHRGEWYWDGSLDGGSLEQWDVTNLRSPSVSNYSYFVVQKKKSWKDKIVWPSVFKEGTWVARNEHCGCHYYYSFEEEPLYDEKGIWSCDCECVYLNDQVLDLSFLPQEFWDCKPEDSLVQVRHEVKG
jgi:hypothetical protein